MMKEPPAYVLVSTLIGEPTEAELDGVLREGVRSLNRLGITSVHDMADGPD